MSNSMDGTFGDSAATRVNEFKDDLGNDLEGASRQVRRGFERAGVALDDGADKLKDGIRHTQDGVKTAGKKISEVVGNSTDYFRTSSAREIIDDVEGLVKEHPGKAILVVAAVGYLLGRSLTSRE